jgi:hypothetical protein
MQGWYFHLYLQQQWTDIHSVSKSHANQTQTSRPFADTLASSLDRLQQYTHTKPSLLVYQLVKSYDTE